MIFIKNTKEIVARNELIHDAGYDYIYGKGNWKTIPIAQPKVQPFQKAQWNDAKHKWEIIDNPDLDYSDKRQISYPTLAEQLDSLWHAIDSGVDLKQSDFYKKNREVKQKFPKPQKSQ